MSAFEPGKRLTVFVLRETKNKGQTYTVWIEAGSAWVNRDGSVNVYLNVLPIDGELHIREALPPPDTKPEEP